GVPTEGWRALVVRDRLDRDVPAVHDLPERLEHDHRPVAAHDPEELVVRGRTAEGDLEPQHVAIEREGRRYVGDDEEGGDAGDRGSRHWRVLVGQSPGRSVTRGERLLPRTPRI